MTIQKSNFKCDDQTGFIPNFKKILWGAEQYFDCKNSPIDLYNSYQAWYKDISSMTNPNGFIYSISDNFMFIKNAPIYSYQLQNVESMYLSNHDKLNPVEQSLVTRVDDFEDENAHLKTTVIILHPGEATKSLEFKFEGKYNPQGTMQSMPKLTWKISLPEDFYPEQKTARSDLKRVQAATRQSTNIHSEIPMVFIQILGIKHCSKREGCR